MKRNLTIIHEIAHSLYAIQHGLLVIKIDIFDNDSGTSHIAYKRTDGQTVLSVDKSVILLILGCVAEIIAKGETPGQFYKELYSSRYVSDRNEINKISPEGYIKQALIQRAFNWAQRNWGEIVCISDAMQEDFKKGERSFQIEEYLVTHD